MTLEEAMDPPEHIAAMVAAAEAERLAPLKVDITAEALRIYGSSDGQTRALLSALFDETAARFQQAFPSAPAAAAGVYATRLLEQVVLTQLGWGPPSRAC